MKRHNLSAVRVVLRNQAAVTLFFIFMLIAGAQGQENEGSGTRQPEVAAKISPRAYQLAGFTGGSLFGVAAMGGDISEGSIGVISAGSVIGASLALLLTVPDSSRVNLTWKLSAKVVIASSLPLAVSSLVGLIATPLTGVVFSAVGLPLGYKVLYPHDLANACNSELEFNLNDGSTRLGLALASRDGNYWLLSPKNMLISIPTASVVVVNSGVRSMPKKGLMDCLPLIPSTNVLSRSNLISTGTLFEENRHFFQMGYSLAMRRSTSIMSDLFWVGSGLISGPLGLLASPFMAPIFKSSIRYPDGSPELKHSSGRELGTAEKKHFILGSEYQVVERRRRGFRTGAILSTVFWAVGITYANHAAAFLTQ